MACSQSDDSPFDVAGRRSIAERLIADAGHISASPPVAFQIASLIRDRMVSTEDLVDLVRLDPDLTVKLLRMCNSAVFRGNNVSSLHEAAVRLGSHNIATRAMFVTVGRLMDVPQTAYCPDPNVLWRHSLQTALAARYLSPFCGQSYNMDTVFTAGLLHDLGKLVINSGARNELSQIIVLREEEKMIDADAELEVLGADHAEIGATILERWNLSADIVAGVRFHHAPDCELSGIANLIHVANACSKVTGERESWEEFENTVHPFVLERLKIDLDDVKTCWATVVYDTDQIEEYFS